MLRRVSLAVWPFLLIFTVGGVAEAQIKVKVQVGPQAGLAEQAKLSPDLNAAEATNALFLGVTPRGEAVLQYGPGKTLDDARKAIANVADKVAVSEQVGEDFDQISELIVVYNQEPQTKKLADLKIVRQHKKGRFVVVASEGPWSSESLRRLKNEKSVRYVEPNYNYRLLQSKVVPNDPLYPELWGMENIRGPRAWSRTTQSPIVVAVIDTGVDYTHSDLSANMWRNEDELPNNGRDDDGNVTVHRQWSSAMLSD